MKNNIYSGFYINLKKDEQRNNSIQEQLKALGFDNYSRFEAIDGESLLKTLNSNVNSGSLGCGFSHKAILEQNLGSKKHLHILEDDAILHPYLPHVFEGLQSKMQWDIIYTDLYFSMLSPTSFYFLNEKYKRYTLQGDISLVDLKGIEFSAATSYFVHKDSVKKLHDYLSDDWYQNFKHDAYINLLVQKGLLKAYVVMPFVSTLSSHSLHSSIDDSYTTNMLALDAIRASFFIDAKQEEISKNLKYALSNLQISEMNDIYTNATRLLLYNLQ